MALESAIFNKLLLTLSEHVEMFQQNAKALATIDCLCSFAQTAAQYGYCKPLLHEGHELDLRESRHGLADIRGFESGQQPPRERGPTEEGEQQRNPGRHDRGTAVTSTPEPDHEHDQKDPTEPEGLRGHPNHSAGES